MSSVGVGKTFTGVFVASVALVVALVVTHEAPRYEAKGTFRTTDLVVDNTEVVKGSVGLCTDGTTTCTGIPHLRWSPTQVAAAATGRMEILGTAAINTQLTGATFVGTTLDLDVFIQGTADTTGGAATFVGGEFDALVSRSAGGNDVSNVALTLDAANGQSNIALKSLAGDIQMANGNFGVLSGNGSVSGTLDVGGTTSLNKVGGTALSVPNAAAVFNDAVTLGDASNDAISIGGSIVTDVIMTSSAIDMILRLTSNATGGHNVAWDNGANAGFFGNKFTLYDNTSSRIDYQIDNATGRFSLGAAAVQQIISAVAPTGASHGTLSTRATDWSGNITSIGSNTSTVLTYSTTFPHGSECTANPIAHGVSPQFIEPVAIAASVTFNCFTTTTGAAANCDDFTYSCIGN